MYDGDYIPAAASCSYPLRSGNAVRPLVDGEPAFRRICEAVESAERSVWVTVAFIEADMQMPDGRGTFFDVLDRAAARGLDVRVLCWREPDVAEQVSNAEIFTGTPEERDWLAGRGTRYRIRWDRVPGLCHHQKSWVIDASRPGEVAFVGGINLGCGSVVSPGHPPIDNGREGRNIHDLYLEVRGPSASDVHHNFAQRWNEASERDRADGVYPSLAEVDDVELPASPAAEVGEVPVQISRTVTRGCYPALPDGERSVLEQYRGALESARRTIYFENQILLCPTVIAGLAGALGRGVEVVVVVPAVAMPEISAARRHPAAAPLFEALDSLGQYERFTMAGLAANRGPGEYELVYVHAKAALVDDVWGTIGSTNTMFRSFRDDTELNASFWHGPTAHRLRCDLFHEHIAIDTSEMTDVEALRRFATEARANVGRRARGEPIIGQAFAIEPSEWAR